jgi:putative effector of murein hydrolase
MADLLQIAILPVALTLLAYQAGALLQKKLRTPLCNPILVAVVLVLVFLGITGMELKTYQAGATYLSWLMTPATICLAISMYEQFRILKQKMSLILISVAAGAISCMLEVLAFGAILGLDRELTASLLPKSVTTAIGVPLSQMAGGLTPITTAAIILTGITASVLGPTMCRIFRLTDEVARGAAFGTAGHVIGTAKASELSPLTGAVSSLSLVVAGLLTAVTLPLIANFL